MTAVWIVLAVWGVYAAFSWTSYEHEDFDPWPLTAPPDDADDHSPTPSARGDEGLGGGAS